MKCHIGGKRFENIEGDPHAECVLQSEELCLLFASYTFLRRPDLISPARLLLVELPPVALNTPLLLVLSTPAAAGAAPSEIGKPSPPAAPRLPGGDTVGGSGGTPRDAGEGSDVFVVLLAAPVEMTLRRPT